MHGRGFEFLLAVGGALVGGIITVGVPGVAAFVKVGEGEGTAEFDFVGFKFCKDVSDVTTDVSTLLLGICKVRANLIQNLHKRLFTHVNLLLLKASPRPDQRDLVNIRHALIVIIEVVYAALDIYLLVAVSRLQRHILRSSNA